MKKLLLTLLLISVCSFAWGTDYTQDANCLGAWLLKTDEDPLSDSSGNSHSLTLRGSGEPNYVTDAPLAYDDGSYDFDGTNDYAAQENTIANMPTGAPMTVTAWIKPDAVNVGNGIFEHGERNISTGWRFKGDNDELTFTTWSVKDYTTNTFTLDTSWNFVALSMQADYDVIFYHWNTTTGMETQEITYTSDFNTPAAGADLILGANHWYGDTLALDTFFGGLITEVAVFDRALNSTELNDIKDNGLDGSQGAPTGWTHTINGVTAANMAKVNSVTKANIAEINQT